MFIKKIASKSDHTFFGEKITFFCIMGVPRPKHHDSWGLRLQTPNALVLKPLTNWLSGITGIRIVHLYNCIKIVHLYNCINIVYCSMYICWVINFLSTSEFTWIKTCVSFMSRERQTCFAWREPIYVYKGTELIWVNQML